MQGKRLNKRKFLKLGLTGACGFCALSGGLPLWSANPVPEKKVLGKFSREAMFYTPTAKGLKCQICPNQCQIKPEENGDCRTRLNKDGKLYTIAYGNPCAVHVDPIEKKPLYHFLPQSNAFSIATAGCNLACLNCQNWEISQAGPLETRNHDLMPESVVESAIQYDCRSIAYTYSDPVAFYEYTYDTAKIAQLKGIKNILVSAGYINQEPLRELAQYVDAANIDLKSFSNEVYEMLNAGTLQPVLDTLKYLKDAGVWLEITNLIVPNWTDDLEMIKKMCGWLAENGFDETPLHFSRFHPQYKLSQLPATSRETLVKAREIAMASGLLYVYLGNLPGTDAENTYCPVCKRLLIERKGYTILKNEIQDGKCPECSAPISGVWE
jgi:pyruvate formate lyase activating enzyme